MEKNEQIIKYEVHTICKALKLRGDRLISIAENCSACRDKKAGLWLIGDEMVKDFCSKAKITRESLDESKRYEPLLQDIDLWAVVKKIEQIKYGYKVTVVSKTKGHQYGKEMVWQTREAEMAVIGRELPFRILGNELVVARV